MTRTEIFTKIQTVIAKQLNQPIETVQLTTNLRRDLNADSLDTFMIINDIEDSFDITLDPDDPITTVLSLVNFIEEAYT